MTTAPLRLPLGPAAPTPPPLADARPRVAGALADLARLTDDTLGRPWSWRGKARDVRYGFYRIYETLEESAVGLAGVLAQQGLRQTIAGRILAQADLARWDLHGLLLPLTTEDLDRQPGGGEWTLRQTLGHLTMSQFRFAVGTAYSVQRARSGGDLPLAPPDEALPPAPDPEAPGSLAELRARLDEQFDLGVGLLGGLDRREDLDAPALWAGYEVTARFRLQRWSAHLREHTIQMEKILGLLDRPSGEVERLARVVLGAYARLESLLVGLPAEALDPPGGTREPSAARLLGQATETLETHTREIILAAAGAPT